VDTCHLAHPAFIHIIDRLSPDEAKLLNHLKEQEHIEYIWARFDEKEILDRMVKNGALYLNGAYFTNLSLSNEIQLSFVENMQLYLDNLFSLGIIEFSEDQFFSKEKRHLYDKLIEKIQGKASYMILHRGQYGSGNIVKTEFGKMFLRA